MKEKLHFPLTDCGKTNNKICSISIDMDPIDHYLKARNYEPLDATNLNAVYEDALPRFLDLFDKYNVKATFFLVGKDAANPKNKLIIREIVQRGHEVANHTYNHCYPFLHLNFSQKKHEIEEADRILSDVTGQKICGFRTPGWGIDFETLSILESLGYSYDSSVFPSRLIFLISSVNSVINKGRLKRGVGSSWKEGLSPKHPYLPSKNAVWEKGDLKIIELPTAILPIVQIPFLATLLYMLGRQFFNLCLYYFEMFNRPLFYELHGIEMVDYYNSINDDRLKMKPGLGMTIQKKLDLYNHMLTKFSARYKFLTLKESGDLYR
jgi:hypothetical protein